MTADRHRGTRRGRQHPRARRALAAAAGALVVAAVGACSDDESLPRDAAGVTVTTAPDPTPAVPTSTTTTAATTTTPTTVGVPDSCPRPSSGSSPAVFDAAGGTYSAQDLTSSEDRAVAFNIVQWLSGDDARRAWLAENPDDPDGPPNDYYIVDENPQIRSAEVRVDATLLRLPNPGNATLEAATLDALGEHLADNPAGTYWLTFDDGDITTICEQYRP